MRYSTEPKTASKWVVQKTAEATADLIGKKITDQITSIGKPKEKEKTKEVDENLYPSRKKRLLMTWDCFEYKFSFPLYKNEISKNCKLSWYNFWW